jgi:putative hemolysin
VVCRDGLEHIVGLLRTSDLLKPALGRTAGHRGQAAPAALRAGSVTTTQLLESFRQARMQIALIVDEYGDWKAW